MTERNASKPKMANEPLTRKPDCAVVRTYQTPRLAVVGKALGLVQGPIFGNYFDGPGGRPRNVP